MDLTLVDGPNSASLRAYIAAHPEKTHHLVTFRSPKTWAMMALDELEEHGLDRSLIADVHSVPHEHWMAHERHLGACEVARARGVESPAMPKDARLYVTFKALTAKRIGATIMVDDKPDHVEAACNEHGIAFLDALGEFPVLVDPEHEGR